MSETTTVVGTSIDLSTLPEKMRAHAAAKALGMTSKEFLAALAERGVTGKSAQSGVTRDQVALLVGEPEGDTAAAQAEAISQTEAAAEAAKPEFSIITGEVGAAEERGRGGRGGRGRRRAQPVPGFSPLFLTPGDSPAADSELNVITISSRADDEVGYGGASEGTSSERGADADSANSDTSAGQRRRRRGRRGRGRGRGDAETSQDTANDNEAAEAGAADDTDQSGDAAQTDESAGAGSDPGDSESRHRRRRRRRKGAADAGSATDTEDPATNDVHERTPRRRSATTGGDGDDEVRGIAGSTRLEAKRRRHQPGNRDGRRRRQHILSEAEFLARREAVDRVMVVRERDRADGTGKLTQVAVVEDKVLVEHFVTTEVQRSMVGNIYLGRVQNVLPSMEAAFIDIGRGRNGVLYAGEVDWEAAGLGGKSRRIEQALKPGDTVVVQVTKDPVGHKGARLSTQISLAGRFLVFTPDGNSAGISRKLPDTERRRLKAILKDIVPAGSGVIIRTAAEGVSAEDIQSDVERLSRKWEKISAQAEKASRGKSGQVKTLYEEPDLLVKVVRDLFNEDFSKLVVQGQRSWDTVHEYVSELAPEMEQRLERFDNPDVDVFSVYRVDEQLAKALDRTVWLPSGGTLVIDRTEAMTVIDVNTGKFTGSGGNLEETVTRNNLEAAEEIVRQLRLRDIGGMVIVDFIDMVLESNRDLVVRRLTEALGRDRTRHQVSEVTSLGLVQITRKRLGTGLLEAFSSKCEHCGGRGIVLHEDPVTASATIAEPDSGSSRRRRSTPSQSEKKSGPAPSAHPMMLAMKSNKHSAGDDADDVDGDSGDGDSATIAEAPSVEVEPTRPAHRARTRRRATRTVGAPAEHAAAPTAAGTPEDVDAPKDVDAPDAAEVATVEELAIGARETRPRRRRRVTRKAGASSASGAPEEQHTTPDGSAAAPDALGAAPRRTRRRVTREAGAPAAEPATTPVMPMSAATPERAEDVHDSPIVPLDPETVMAPDAAALAVNKSAPRRARRMVRRAAGSGE